MAVSRVSRQELVSSLSGVVALCDVTIAQLGNRAKARTPLTLIRKAAERMLPMAVPSPRESDADKHEGIVLVVEEDALSLLSLEHQLRSLGLIVLAAQRPSMAQQLVTMVKGKVDLLLWGLRGDEPLQDPTPGCEACRELTVAYVTDRPRPEFDESVERPVILSDLDRLLARTIG